jgi:hypothetical protein
MKRIALLLSGNIRTFFANDNYIANKYLELVNNQDIDVFIYTDNNDFNYNNIQYLSENNKDKILGISNDYEKRLSKDIRFINYNDGYNIISENIIKIFGNRLKKFNIENFDPKLINTIYDKNNIYHNTFMNNKYVNFNNKQSLMCQFYKLYKCYNQLCYYEIENNFTYDIIIKSRFDVFLTNLNNYDIKKFDLNNQLYCYNFGIFISDTWAIGNRFIMDKYCNYYINMSCNMTDGMYCFKNINGDWKIVNSNNIESFRNENNNIILEDISYSGEFGLIYIVKYKYNYNIYHLDLSEISYKFYL